MPLSRQRSRAHPGGSGGCMTNERTEQRHEGVRSIPPSLTNTSASLPIISCYQLLQTLSYTRKEVLHCLCFLAASKAFHQARGRQCLSRQRFAAPRPLWLHDECVQRSEVFAWRTLALCRSCVCPPFKSASRQAAWLGRRYRPRLFAAFAWFGMAASVPQACHQD